MPWYIGDYQKDTQHLSCLEHGAYRLLIDAYWCNRGPLPDNDEDFARICRLSLSDWTAIRLRIAVFFKIEPVNSVQGRSQWRHTRVDLELSKSLKLKERNSLGAKLTNQKRWGKASHSVSLSDSHSVSPNGRPSPSPSPSHVQTPPTPSFKSTSNGNAIGDFEKFWNAYPNKVAKFDAEHAWCEVNASRHVPEIMQAIKLQSGSEAWSRDNGRFIPNPATWLRDGRWNDSPSKYKPASCF